MPLTIGHVHCSPGQTLSEEQDLYGYVEGNVMTFEKLPGCSCPGSGIQKL